MELRRFERETLLLKENSVRPRGDSNPHVQYTAYLLEVLCPSKPQPIESRFKLSTATWHALIEQRKSNSLRQLAKEYGVSYEAVRRTLKALGMYRQ